MTQDSCPQVTEHRDSCPQVHTTCSYRRLGCSLQDTRGNMKLHEDSDVQRHLLMVLRSNTHLEQQVELLQQEAQLRRQEEQRSTSLLSGLQENLTLQNGDSECTIAAAQRTLNRQEDVLSTVHLDVHQVSRGLRSSLEDLDQLRKSLDALIQDVSSTEALKEHLESLQDDLQHQSHLLDLHAAQLSRHRQQLQQLETTSHDGTLVWKIGDLKARRDAEVKGQPPCLSSAPFHVGRCGYKMAAKVYLNGDGDGRGTHLSLYVVLMPGDFDALLPWPFDQTVTLSLLDQSGDRNHRSLSFRPDPASRSVQRPTANSGNVAVGFSRFIALEALESPQTAAYVCEDTLFVRVKVDLTGVEL